MGPARRWAVALTGVAASVALAAGCGSSGGSVASVPAAPGAPLADRLLTADELGIPGYSATREPVEPQDAVDSEAGDPCTARRTHEVQLLQKEGLQARVRRSFTSEDGGALSIVQQFATSAGAQATRTALIADLHRRWLGCDASIATTDFDTRRLDQPPDAILVHTVQTGNGQPPEAWNVFFTDGRFLYTVGAVGTGASRQAVVAAAQRAYDTRGD